MDLASWVPRRLLRSFTKHQNPNRRTEFDFKPQHPETEEQLGITQELVDYVRSFTLDTFRNYPIQDNDEIPANAYNEDEGTTTSFASNIRKDLSDWQEKHATSVLSRVKELSQLRFSLCPRYLKEHLFWRIYFKLVRSHVAEYELRAIQRAKIRRMAMENERVLENAAAVELEMSETKHSASSKPAP